MSTCISTEQQVLQRISFTILNDSTIENKFSQEGRRWRKAMRTIRKQTGWLRTLWGRDMNTSYKIDIFIGMNTDRSLRIELIQSSFGRWMNLLIDVIVRLQSGPTSERQNHSKPAPALTLSSKASTSLRSQSTALSRRAIYLHTASQN